MCERAQCTSPMGAREPAGTLCPTSLAQTVAEGLPGGGDDLFCLMLLSAFFYFFNILLMLYRQHVFLSLV